MVNPNPRPHIFARPVLPRISLLFSLQKSPPFPPSLGFYYFSCSPRCVRTTHVCVCQSGIKTYVHQRGISVQRSRSNLNAALTGEQPAEAELTHICTVLTHKGLEGLLRRVTGPPPVVITFPSGRPIRTQHPGTDGASPL